MSRVQEPRKTLVVCVLLAVATFAVFLPALHNNFVALDDQTYVTDNPIVQSGLNASSIRWAFTTSCGSNWHPLTWLSHEADCQLFGMNPAGHHLSALFLHSINAALLFLFLSRLSRAPWRSALVAALFALHPLRVESVVWIAERKDVLSTFFFLLTLICYNEYVQARNRISPPAPAKRGRRPNASAPASGAHRASCCYLLALVLFALGLMSKPMLVTLPFVLLILDFWPLKRWTPFAPVAPIKILQPRPAPFSALVLEKLPFFLLAGGSCVVTFLVQRHGGAMANLENFPVEQRLANAPIACLFYLVKTMWPTHLAPFYPMASAISPLWVLLAICVVGGVSWIVWRQRRHAPWWFAGWLWFLGTLVPVIGLVQVGFQSMADRYTYIPSIGLFIGLVWGLAELAKPRPAAQKALACVALLGCVLCAALTLQQAKLWKDSKTLFRYTLSVTANNALAHESLGDLLAQEGKIDEAAAHFAEAVRIIPGYAQAHTDLGLALILQDKVQEGMSHYRTALAISPKLERAHFNLAKALVAQGNTTEAIEHYRAALELRPDWADNRSSLAETLVAAGAPAEALTLLEQRLQQVPADIEAHLGYACLLGSLGKTDEAANQFQETLKLDPRNVKAHRHYGLLLVRSGHPLQGLEHFQTMATLSPSAEASCHIALALATLGRPTEAIVRYHEALRRDPSYLPALNDLAWLLATHPAPELRNGQEALMLAQKACELTQNDITPCLSALDVAYAETKDFNRAIAAAENTRRHALQKGESQLAAAAEYRLALYHKGEPFHQRATAGPAR